MPATQTVETLEDITCDADELTRDIEFAASEQRNADTTEDLAQYEACLNDVIDALAEALKTAKALRRRVIKAKAGQASE